MCHDNEQWIITTWPKVLTFVTLKGTQFFALLKNATSEINNIFKLQFQLLFSLFMMIANAMTQDIKQYMEGIPFFTQFTQSCNVSKSALCSWLFIIVIAVAKDKWGNRFNGVNLKECFTILPDWWWLQWQRINGSIVGWFNLCRSGFKRFFKCFMIYWWWLQ